MSAGGYLELGISPREALFLEQLAQFKGNCFASMSWLASKLKITVRHAFRLQAELKERGLMSSTRSGDRNQTPPGAKSPAKLRHNGWAIRDLAGPAAIMLGQVRAEVEAWRRKRDEKRAANRAEQAARRERRAQRVATENPPTPAPYHSARPVAEVADALSPAELAQRATDFVRRNRSG